MSYRRLDGFDLVLAVCLLALGFALAILTNAGQPYCPHEDSCYSDYYDGGWHIIPGERPRSSVQDITKIYSQDTKVRHDAGYEPALTMRTPFTETDSAPIKVRLDNGGTLLTDRQQ